MLTTEIAKRGEPIRYRIGVDHVLIICAHPEGLESMRYEIREKRSRSMRTTRSIERRKPKG